MAGKFCPCVQQPDWCPAQGHADECIYAPGPAPAVYPPPADQWCKVENEGEAVGAIPCDTCKGYRAVGESCAWCADVIASAPVRQKGQLVVADPKPAWGLKILAKVEDAAVNWVAAEQFSQGHPDDPDHQARASQAEAYFDAAVQVAHEAHEAQSKRMAELESTLEWTETALIGSEVPDFAASFGVVARAIDLWYELKRLRRRDLERAACCQENEEKAALATAIVEVAKEAAGKLEEVRTGEDFETECWEVAAKLRVALKAFYNKRGA